MSTGLIRRLADVLSMADRGRFEASCNEALTEALESLKQDPSGKGTADIVISLKIAMKNEMVQISPALKCKLPDGKSFAPLVLWEHEGALSTQHPHQIGMFDKGDDKVTALPQAGG
jgi:hypothetical protein